MPTLDDIMSDRGEPASEILPEITDADRAANPIGTAKLERDIQGRFAPKTRDGPQDGDESEKPEADQPQAEPDQRRGDGKVPQGALSAERGKRKEAESEAAALRREIAELRGQFQGMQRPQQAAPQPEKPAAPPEIWADPNAWAEHQLRGAISPVQQQMQNLTLDWSRRFAVQQHGSETVDKAIQGLSELRQTNPAEYQRFEAAASNSMDPVGDVVKWHKQQITLREVGSDPDAWRNAERERIRADLMAEMGASDEHPQQQPAPQAAPRLPSSFAAVRAGGPRGGPQYRGPRALSEIMPRG